MGHKTGWSTDDTHNQPVILSQIVLSQLSSSLPVCGSPSGSKALQTKVVYKSNLGHLLTSLEDLWETRGRAVWELPL